VTRHITQRELRNDSGAILRAVRDQGETFIITTNGTPTAELGPLPKTPKPTSTAELIQSARNLPTIDYATFRADIDKVIDSSLFAEPDINESNEQDQ
jgi:prevent-host-death family protein